MLIGISGKAGHGKNSLAKIITIKLINDYDIMPSEEAFADALKRSAGDLFFTEEELEYLGRDLFGNEVKSATSFGMTFGTFLQKYGMMMRELLGKDIWVDKFENNRDRNRITIVTDVRLENEAQHIHNNGYLIRVERPGHIEPGRDPQHVSEVTLDKYDKFDYYLKANNLGEMQKAFEDIWLDLSQAPKFKEFLNENSIVPAQN